MDSSLMLKNVKRINGNKVDIVIKDKIITSITDSSKDFAGKVIDCTDMYVSSGWIDMHVHAFKDFEPYGDEIDVIGINQGVTTLIDAGSCGTDRIDELIARGNQSKTNLLAFLNVSQIGLKRIDELSNLSWIKEDDILSTIEKYKDHIVGLKVRMSNSVVGENGLQPLLIAKKIAAKARVPIMVHVGSSPPDIKDIVAHLEKNDIITHFLNGKENKLFREDGQPYQEVIDAIKRGVHLDVGHGTASFSFATAKLAKTNEITFDTISTDIYRGNRIDGPVYSMAHTLSKFLYLGYSLEDVINAVTVNPAQWLNKLEPRQIKVGKQANLTLFSVDNKTCLLTDSEGVTYEAPQTITAKGVVINGEVIIY